MARLTTILYASASALTGLSAELKPAREAQPIRLIALEEFRGETEQNAGAVYVAQPADPIDNFDVLRDAIAQAYPHLNIRDYADGAFDVAAEASTHHMEAADDQMRQLRMTLIAAGGSAPANASAEELSNLIASQRAREGLGARTPVLPTPATAATVIPDSTPVVQRIGADKLVAESAVGTSPEALKIAQDEAGAGSGSTAPGAFSPTESGTRSPDLPDLDKVSTHAQAETIAKAEGVTIPDDAKTVDAKVALIRAARG